MPPLWSLSATGGGVQGRPMRPIRLIASAAVLAAILLPAAAGAKLPGTVAWQEEIQDTGSDVYVARADGTSGRLALTRSSERDPAGCFEQTCGAGMAQWFANGDGTRVIFDASWNTFVSLWTIKPDGTDAVQLPQINDIDGVPGVASDGSLVVFESTTLDGSAEGIYIKGLASTTATRLTADPPAYYDTNPDLSPDNARVAFQRVYVNSDRVEIWAMNADGSHLQRLLSSGRRWGDPYF